MKNLDVIYIDVDENFTEDNLENRSESCQGSSNCLEMCVEASLK